MIFFKQMLFYPITEFIVIQDKGNNVNDGHVLVQDK